MSTTVKNFIRRAAEGFATIPADFATMKIKDAMPNQNDWDDFNKRLCDITQKTSCPIGEDELDDFWTGNKTFGDLIQYADAQCGYND